MHAPPAALIFFSARAEKNLALTTNGTSGSEPLPSTLKMPLLMQSITGALAAVAASRACDTTSRDGHAARE